jgi:hypothetical protein
MTYDEFVAIARELPGVTEESRKDGSCVSRDGQSMFWLKKWTLLCIKLNWDVHDEMLEHYPSVLFKTPHFESYPALHANLERLNPELAKELVQFSWDNAPRKVKFRKQLRL